MWVGVKLKEAVIVLGVNQDWEFAHQFSERITLFFPKNEQMSNLLKKTRDSLIRSLLVSVLIDSLMIAHF